MLLLIYSTIIQRNDISWISAWKARYHQLYTCGYEKDCSQWEKDYQNCVEYRTNGNLEALVCTKNWYGLHVMIVLSFAIFLQWYVEDCSITIFFLKKEMDRQPIFAKDSSVLGESTSHRSLMILPGWPVHALLSKDFRIIVKRVGLCQTDVPLYPSSYSSKCMVSFFSCICRL